MESSLPINEVAKRTGLTAYTLRYYERIGLIEPVARAEGGQRRYAASDMAWLGFLLRLRETGMPIHGMQAFAKLRSEGNATVSARQAMLENHLTQVMAQVQALQQSAQVLQAKIVHYQQLAQPVPAAQARDSASQVQPLASRKNHDRYDSPNFSAPQPL